MKWSLELIAQIIIGTGLLTALLNWRRFRNKDKAEVSKIASEIGIDSASVNAKKVDDEIKISKAALEWAVQLGQQLKDANITNDKKQLEIDKIRELMQTMKDDFERRMDEMDKLMEQTQKELNIEKQKNVELLIQINEYTKLGKS